MAARLGALAVALERRTEPAAVDPPSGSEMGPDSLPLPPADLQHLVTGDATGQLDPVRHLRKLR